MLAGPNKTKINEAINDLKKLKYNLEINSNFEDYLGVNFDWKEDRSIKLT